VIVEYPLKLAGVIVIAFVPPVETLMIVFTCPSAPSAIAHECVAEVALISVIAVVTFTAVVEEPSAVIACDACFKPKKEGMLLKTSSAAIFLLIGVPVYHVE
jgi:hypothetical protein